MPSTAPRSCCSAICSRPPRTRQLLVVLTYRSAELTPGHALTGLLDDIERDRRLSRVPLSGLPEAAVARFFPPDAAVGAGALHELHERTAGNPFFLRELVRLLAERGELYGDGATLPVVVPDRVREVVGRRLEPLMPATREVLAIAGVVGRPFTIAGVARIGGLGRESVAQALQPALSGRLLEARPDAPGRFGFAHAIVRDAVYDELPPALRARLHASAAALLQESLEAGGDATAAEAAHHALAAARCGADPQPAWDLSLEAAQRGGGAAGARGGRRPLRRRPGGARAGRRGRRARPPGDVAGVRRGDVRRGRHRRRPRPVPQRRGGRAPQRRRRDPRAGGARLLRGAAVRVDRHRRDRAPPGGAGPPAARRQRAARPRLRPARPAARPRHRPGAARGAGRRGRRDGPPPRRRRGAGLAPRRGRPGQLAAGTRRRPPRRHRGGAGSRGAGRRSGGGLLGAHDPPARCAQDGGARRRGRRARSPRAAHRGEPPDVLPLVPAGAPGRPRHVRRPARRGRAARRGGGGAEPPLGRGRPGVHRPARGARAPAPPRE